MACYRKDKSSRIEAEVGCKVHPSVQLVAFKKNLVLMLYFYLFLFYTWHCSGLIPGAVLRITPGVGGLEL